MIKVLKPGFIKRNIRRY